MFLIAEFVHSKVQGWTESCILGQEQIRWERVEFVTIWGGDGEYFCSFKKDILEDVV